ncbi:hypothetical protein ZOSMA_8G01490 [Zostera marina]|uniref:RIN4 pathogenic type III effector avirulence factor Avr cleavage site domain-containing protein n=1 Tax=Zostera marina TaxID=29655 RepID=A0A0K9NLY5_ZOSMR|nr:hypothetical protein ZOSMA_8G01490 [Zostera marina]
MENPKRTGSSVPVFGDWDVAQEIPDYYMDFTKIREMKMKRKQDFSRISVGNEAELVLTPTSDPPNNLSSSPHPPAASVHNHIDHGDDENDHLHQITSSHKK